MSFADMGWLLRSCRGTARPSKTVLDHPIGALLRRPGGWLRDESPSNYEFRYLIIGELPAQGNRLPPVSPAVLTPA
jgi:hypothetical protein